MEGSAAPFAALPHEGMHRVPIVPRSTTIGGLPAPRNLFLLGGAATRLGPRTFSAASSTPLLFPALLLLLSFLICAETPTARRYEIEA